MKINLFSFEWFPFLTAVILHDRISWSIRLRWLAVIGFFSATLVSKYSLGLVVPYEIIWLLLAGLALINFIYYLIAKLFKEFTFISELIVLHVHIFFDLLFLTFIVHFSGGIENPIFLFYAFHVVISSIIFPGLIPLFFTTLVVLLFGSLIYLEYSGIIPHYNLFHTALHKNIIAISLIYFVFIVTVYVTAYICSTFMQIYRDIKKKIDLQNQQKTQFFHFTSHELKSPIIAIKSSLDGIIKNYAGQIDERGLNVLVRASKRSGQMIEILKELLELSKNRGLTKKEEGQLYDLNEILREVVNQDLAQAEAKNISVRCAISDQPAYMLGIRDDIKRVFVNLLSNAIRYTADDGRIDVSSHQEDGKLIISFNDTGIGILEKDLPNIFTEFYRSENAKKVVSFGTGLGLSLVKQIVENYQGTIEVSSQENQGSKFTLTLPLYLGTK